MTTPPPPRRQAPLATLSPPTPASPAPNRPPMPTPTTASTPIPTPSKTPVSSSASAPKLSLESGWTSVAANKNRRSMQMSPRGRAETEEPKTIKELYAAYLIEKKERQELEKKIKELTDKIDAYEKSKKR